MQYHERNEAVIETLQPGLRNLVRFCTFLCSRRGEDFLIYCGFRTSQEQMKEFLEGDTEVLYPWSFHNHGAAIDLVPVMFGRPWHLKWGAGRRYKRIAGIFKQYGFNWGGDWNRFRDQPHLEYSKNYSIIDYIRGAQVQQDEYRERVLDVYHLEEKKLRKALNRQSIEAHNRRPLIEKELDYIKELTDRLVV